MALATAFRTPYPRTADGDRVRTVLETHYEALWRFLRRMGVGESEVEDAAQHVMLVFAQRAWMIAGAAERSFLFGTAIRVASDFRRKRRRSAELADDVSLLELAHPTPNAESQFAEHELRRWLDRLLDELEPKFRAVFVLAELEELTMSEISELLDIPPGTVASRLRRARELFESKAILLKARLESIEPNEPNEGNDP
jgi:RNA polymerase sigma-70 factor (ECF subfamily)